MIQNYFLLALRNIKRQPGYTVLNVLGLTVGITTTLFVLLYLSEELRYDKYHENADRIYRISSDITTRDEAFRWAVTQPPLAMQLKADYPEVEEYVRFIPGRCTGFTVDDKFYPVDKVYVVDTTVTDIFKYQFVTGDPQVALRSPNSVALAQSTADRIFGEIEPMGQILEAPDGRRYEVTGVYKDQPNYSHIIANALITASSIDGLANPSAQKWGSFYIYTYVLLHPEADAIAFEKKLELTVENFVSEQLDQAGWKVKYELINIQDIHLKSTFEGDPEPQGEVGYLYIFGAVAFFMLSMACINYMNLSTARATKRAMEVGIRKVLGSSRKQLIAQFLLESVIFTLSAVILSYGMLLLLLPVFNNKFELDLQWLTLFSPQIIIGVILTILFTGIIGGSYPAFYLSGLQPINVLKGSSSRGTKNPSLRKTLVGIQFATTLFMIVGTGIIYDQMQYLREKDLGFNKNNLMTFTLEDQESRGKYPVLKQQLLQNPKISNVSSSGSAPGKQPYKYSYSVEKADGSTGDYSVNSYGVDFDYFATMGIEFVAGRNFDPKFSTDSNLALVVNEAMVERMGWTEPIGRKVKSYAKEFSTVIGVVKDFHQASLYDPIEALLFVPYFNNHIVSARINSTSASDLSGILGFMEEQWNDVIPKYPFEFEFVDSAFMELYATDIIRGRIFTLFSILMIFIACLGLFGLASFMAEQRTKEIGVRIIFGAGSNDIVYLLIRNFVILVAIASIPAFWAARYFMNTWLDTFNYHTNMNYWMYGFAFFIVVSITILTTGYHALKAANRNPVDALRYE